MAQHNELGKLGEEIAVRYLLEQGYKILERNWRNQHKEIDIIAMDGEELVIVEVKARMNDDFGEPYMSVTRPTLVDILRKLLYLQKQDGCEYAIRYHFSRFERGKPRY
jgi:putative endonuclease